MRRQNRFRGFQRSMPDSGLNKSSDRIRLRGGLAVHYFNALRKFRPALKTVFAGDHQLRVCESKFADLKSRLRKFFKTWMASFDAANRLHICRAIGLQ